MKNLLVLLATSLFFGSASALPMLEEPVPLPASFEGIITIYPDSHNTAAVQNFWLAPSTARIVRNPPKPGEAEGKLAFGLVHSGISGFDPDGVSALLTATFQPYVDAATVKQATDLISKSVEAAGGKAFFRYIAPKETEVYFLVGGQYVDWTGRKPNAVVKGGLVEAGIPFQIKVKDSQDARALSQAGGDDASTMGVQFRMKFDGIRGRCHFLITGKFKETYEHFKAAVSASGWFGLARASARVEIQKLVSKDAIKIQLYQCTQEKFDKYFPTEAVEGLMTQLAARTGAFARTLKANGLPDAPGGGGMWGWSFSAGGGFESYDEDREISYEYDLNFTEEQEFTFGMAFPTGGNQLKSYVKNLTDTNKPFPTSTDFKTIRTQMAACRKANLAALKKLLADGDINQTQYDKYVEQAMERGCYVDYTLTADNSKLFGRQLKALRDRRDDVSPAMLLEFQSK